MSIILLGLHHLAWLSWVGAQTEVWKEKRVKERNPDWADIKGKDRLQKAKEKDWERIIIEIEKADVTKMVEEEAPASVPATKTNN